MNRFLLGAFTVLLLAAFGVVFWQPSARATYPPAVFTCIVVSVHDGDTLRCQDGTRVRLSGIDAPELGPCPPTHCAPGNGIESRDTLRRMIQGRAIQCTANGTSYNRVTAWCSLGGRDLSCAMIRTRQAVRWVRYDPEGRLTRC